MLNPTHSPSNSSASNASDTNSTYSESSERAIRALDVLRTIADHDRELAIEGSTAEQLFLTHLDIAAQSTLSTIAEGITPARILRTFKELQESIEVTAPGSHSHLRLEQILHGIRGVLAATEGPPNLLNSSLCGSQNSSRLVDLPLTVLIERVRAWHTAIQPILTEFSKTLTVATPHEIDVDRERDLVLIGREATTKVVEQLSITAFPHLEYTARAMELLLSAEKLCRTPKAKNAIAAQLAHIKGELASYGV